MYGVAMAASWLALSKQQSVREWSAHSSVHAKCSPISILSNRCHITLLRARIMLRLTLCDRRTCRRRGELMWMDGPRGE